MRIKKVTVPKEEHNYEEADVRKILKAVEREEHPLKKLRDKSIFQILLETGFRMHVICDLTVNDVHIDNEGNLVISVKEKGGKILSRKVIP